MTLVARRLLEVRSVSEVVQAERRPERHSILHAFRFLDVTGSAARELFIGLMAVTGVALRMPGHGCLEGLFVEAVTEIAFGRAFGHLLRVHLIPHLIGIRVIAMRKPLNPKLSKARGKLNSGAFCVDRRLVTNDAHCTFLVCEVLRVTLDAGLVCGQNWLGIVGRSHVASCAVLRFSLVLFAIVIEGRYHFYHFRVDDIKG